MKYVVALLVCIPSLALGDEPPRLTLDLELYTQARMIRRSSGDDLSELHLDRGEVGARVAVAPDAGAELRLESLRSADDGGALGIDGNSLVVRVKVAQVDGQTELGPVRLDGALGVVRDPWIRSLEDDYTLKPLSRTASERLLGWPTSDLSARAGIGVGPVHASVAFGNGEGLRYPERNTGKTTTAVVDAVLLDDSAKLVLSAMVRDGSVGVASIRDQRFGGAVRASSPWIRGGVEVVRALGIADQAEAKGLVVGGWAEGRVIDQLYVSARGASLKYDEDGRQSTFGGAIAGEPYKTVRVWLAIDRQTSSGTAMPVAGTNETVIMVIASAHAPFEVK